MPGFRTWLRRHRSYARRRHVLSRVAFASLPPSVGFLFTQVKTHVAPFWDVCKEPSAQRGRAAPGSWRALRHARHWPLFTSLRQASSRVAERGLESRSWGSPTPAPSARHNPRLRRGGELGSLQGCPVFKMPSSKLHWGGHYPCYKKNEVPRIGEGRCK